MNNLQIIINNLIKLIMKNPLPSITAFIALIVPYFGAIIYFDYKPIMTLGYAGIIASSIIFSSIMVFGFWFIARIISYFGYVKYAEQKKEWYEIMLTWRFNITVGSSASAIYSLITLFICICFDVSRFRYFIIMTYSLLLLRFVLLIYEYHVHKRSIKNYKNT